MKPIPEEILIWIGADRRAVETRVRYIGEPIGRGVSLNLVEQVRGIEVSRIPRKTGHQRRIERIGISCRRRGLSNLR